MSDHFVPQTPAPPTPKFLRVSFPASHVVLARMDNPSSLNALSTDALIELDHVMRWYDADPSLFCLVLTGTGRAFTAGADLKEWRRSLDPGSTQPFGTWEGITPLTRRKGKKPIIAAVNGLALGGGCEIIVNCDMTVAAENATFALPEVTIGLAPVGGVLARLVHTVGMHLACEIVLTGRRISALEMASWGLVNKVVPQESVVPEAIRLATMIAANSPDGVICARAGLRQAWQTADVEQATEEWIQQYFRILEQGENIREGMTAFIEKRKPIWQESKL